MSTLLPPEEIETLVQLLSHPNPEVRTQALTLIPPLLNDETSVNLLKQHNFYKPLLRCVRENHPTSSTLALKIIVNLAAEEEHRQPLIEAGITDTCMEYLQVNLSKSARLPLLVLNNITSSSQAAASLMQEGKAYEGLHVTRLIKWLCDSSRYIPGRDAEGLEKDDIGIAANVLTNLSQLPSFRYVIIYYVMTVFSI